MYRLYIFWQILCWTSLTLINNIITLHDTKYNNKVKVKITGVGICNIHSFHFRGSLIEKSYVFEADKFTGSICNFTMASEFSNDYIAFNLNDRLSNTELLKLSGVSEMIDIDRSYKKDDCFGFNSKVMVRYTNSKADHSQMEFTVMWGTRYACLPGRKCIQCNLRNCYPSRMHETIFFDERYYIPSKFYDLHCRPYNSMHGGWIFLIIISCLLIILLVCGVACFRKRRNRQKITSVQSSPYFQTLPEINPSRHLQNIPFTRKSEVLNDPVFITNDKTDVGSKDTYVAYQDATAVEDKDTIENTYTYI